MKTYSAKPSEVKQGWYLIDAKDKVLGRLASEIAKRLRGKHKPEYTPHVDTGDYIVVVNADQVKVTGNKVKDKMYYRVSGYIGGIKEESFEKLRNRKPEDIIRIAVKGMLPKNSLGSQMLTKLKIFAGSEHTHTAQQPELIEVC